MRRLLMMGLAVGSCWLTLGPVMAAEDCRNTGAFHQEFVWQDGPKSGRALFLFECAPSGLNSRLLVETPRGSRVTITETDDVRRGIKIIRLLDDASGWWLEVSRDSNFKAKDLGDFFTRVYDDMKPGQPLGLEIRTRDGLTFRTRTSYREHPEPEHEDLVRGIRAAGDADKLLAAVPPAVVDAVRFLASARNADSRQLVFLPAPAAVLNGLEQADAVPSRSPDPYSGLRWQEQALQMRKGLVVTDPELLEFVSRFRSVSIPDPLADHRLAEVVPPVEDSSDP